MTQAILDTNIIVDLLRGFPPALAWQQSQVGNMWSITSIVWMEVVEGAQNKRDQTAAIRLLNQFQLIPTIQRDMDWAMQQLKTYHLSHNVDMLDCLIAAPVHRLQMTLHTRNLKHFVPLLNTLAVQPY